MAGIFFAFDIPNLIMGAANPVRAFSEAKPNELAVIVVEGSYQTLAYLMLKKIGNR